MMVITFGANLAKAVLAVHGVDGRGKTVFRPIHRPVSFVGDECQSFPL